MRFPVSKIELIPAHQDIKFSYSARLTDGKALPKELITFDSSSLEFEVRSENSAFAGEHLVTVEAVTDHEHVLNIAI